jgi:hypothetical protein
VSRGIRCHRDKVPDRDTRHLIAFLIYAPNYGILRAAVDGQALETSFDAYGPVVIPTGAISFGTIELIEGPHRLTLEVAGKNLASRGFLFGLDCIVLEPR